MQKDNSIPFQEKKEKFDDHNHVPISNIVSKFTWSIPDAKNLASRSNHRPVIEKRINIIGIKWKFSLNSNNWLDDENNGNGISFNIACQHDFGDPIDANINIKVGNKPEIQRKYVDDRKGSLFRDVCTVDEIILSDNMLDQDNFLHIQVTVILGADNFGIKGRLHEPSLVKPPILPKTFKDLLDTGIFSDVIVNVGKKQYNLHRAILAQSPVFQAQLSNNMMESKTGVIDLDDINIDAFDNLIEFFYTGKCRTILNTKGEPTTTISRDLAEQTRQLFKSMKRNMVSLRMKEKSKPKIEEKTIEKNQKTEKESMEKIINILLCADRFQVSSLINICVTYLSVNVTLNDAVELWLLADRMETTCFALKRQCLDIVAKNRGNILSVFQQMSELPAAQSIKLQKELADRISMTEVDDFRPIKDKYRDVCVPLD